MTGNPHDTTIANADLWSKYFQDEWSRWLNPLGAPSASPVGQLAEGTGARVANFLTLVAAGPIAWMYQAQARPAGEGDTLDEEDAAEEAEKEHAAA